MRTLLNIKLYELIRRNPEHFIGQRNFDVFQAFMLPINSGTQFKYSEDLIPTLESMPSMREYVSDILKIKIPDSVRWTWAIEFNVEDQRALLDSYFDWVFKYEAIYPIQTNKYQWKYDESKQRLRIIELLKHVCKRPGMFGVYDLAGLRALIDGEFYLKEYFNIELTENELKLKAFINYWKLRTNESLIYDSWDRPFAHEKLGISPFTFPNGNGGWVFERFIQIMVDDVGLDLNDPIDIN